MSATNTIIKVIFIATAITLVLYWIQDVRAISNTVAGITKIINRTPLIGMLTSYIGVNLTAFYERITALYDTMSAYGMPDIQKPDTYYM